MRKERKKPHPLAALAGKRISQFRNAREWTQEELGRRAGLSQKWISDIERGRTALQLDTLARLAGALSVLPYELILETPAAGRGRLDARKVLSTVERCDEDRRRVILRVVETLAEYGR